MPDASNEEIMDAVYAYMKDTYAPKKASLGETYPDTTIAKEKRRPDVIKSPKDSPFKKRVKAAQDVKKEDLQEALKKIAKAKNIILKSSKKRIR